MGNLRIIVADDHPEFRILLAHMLRQHFKVVCVVEDGKSLVEAACWHHPDLIVSDVYMPGLTGPEAMKELSARGERIAFVLISAELNVEVPPPGSFVEKSALCTELVPAIHAAASGKTYDSRQPRLFFPDHPD